MPSILAADYVINEKPIVNYSAWGTDAHLS